MYFNCQKQIQCEGQAVRCRFCSLQRKNYAKDLKNHQREVPAILDAINKIAVVKSCNGMPLTFVLVYHEYAMFAPIIGKYMIILNNNLV